MISENDLTHDIIIYFQNYKYLYLDCSYPGKLKRTGLPSIMVCTSASSYMNYAYNIALHDEDYVEAQHLCTKVILKLINQKIVNIPMSIEEFKMQYALGTITKNIKITLNIGRKEYV